MNVFVCFFFILLVSSSFAESYQFQVEKGVFSGRDAKAEKLYAQQENREYKTNPTVIVYDLLKKYAEASDVETIKSAKEQLTFLFSEDPGLLSKDYVQLIQDTKTGKESWRFLKGMDLIHNLPAERKVELFLNFDKRGLFSREALFRKHVSLYEEDFASDLIQMWKAKNKDNDKYLDINFIDSADQNLLHYVSGLVSGFGELNYYIEHSKKEDFVRACSKDSLNSNHQTPFMTSVSQCGESKEEIDDACEEILKRFIEMGCDVVTPDKDGVPPLELLRAKSKKLNHRYAELVLRLEKITGATDPVAQLRVDNRTLITALAQMGANCKTAISEKELKEMEQRAAETGSIGGQGSPK
ncbi:MAG: hypothetical protein A2504_13390 [Bdellovibrionales bacterium RIFOXYD12_FULL_39_22]|nr:MAG: hypothetical protein A2385_01190 [Bdellovibrionales bacterium RIFOXYB1_FULL_39_21]OFZ43620.1 MAG: hypothetical protein A2485_12860 [Bdellovibrionales bacterium RIFOXYC12_FULL_39_17]OFZ44639.1 MAG: hypothetical protein A2404_10550 [Bdellovibrionales bacterium RIFOXYC1_FULL_39_130]OFZ73689.1 MAG: hypothetical protein A2451_01395 [Bdellovibrionales bacterium RIFOXYC2_FULL_39_8]OFZ76398.1 MAG: hypothetical protein A2560_07170 [Bdellovibrionales bacterium RIFOXYD1_FULL_39_84]OFZ94664.1 MAG: